MTYLNIAKTVFGCITGCILLLFSVTFCFAECSSDDAYNRGIAFGKWSTDYQTKMSEMLQQTPHKYNAMVDFMRKITTLEEPIGQLLADGKYSEVCGHYDKIEKLIGEKLNPKAAGTMTMEQLNKGLNRSDKTKGCDMVQFVKKMMATSQSFETKFAAGGFTDKEKEAFSIELGPVQSMVTQNPAKACQQLEEIDKKWGL